MESVRASGVPVPIPPPGQLPHPGDRQQTSIELTDITRDPSTQRAPSERESTLPLISPMESTTSENADENTDENPSFAQQRKDTKPKEGLWEKQMFVDQSLRSMAAFMVALATIMVVSCISLAPKLGKGDLRTTSIPIVSGSQGDMNAICEVLKFFINVAATIVLSSSNTYQHLITSLDIRDIRHALTKFGDSQVATNSPFAIKHKRVGRWKAFSAWALLICTSVPVHLLANSVIGVTQTITEAVDKYEWHPLLESNSTLLDSGGAWGGCWSIFRLGHWTVDPDYVDWFPASDLDYSSDQYDCRSVKNDRTQYPNPWETLRTPEEKSDCHSVGRIFYDKSACGQYSNQSTSNLDALDEYYHADSRDGNIMGNCTTSDIACHLDHICDRIDHKLVVRLSAAIILAICLTIKAAYMVAVNVRGRSRVKSRCLTFGDVLVASVIENIRIPNECLVNNGDFHRQKTTHECHKHCKAWADTSDTGDDIGHCQTCCKFNSVDHMSNLPWPALSTKHKKSLIANLGQTALTQMLILSLCSTALLAVSMILTVYYISYYSVAVCADWTTYSKQFTTVQALFRMQGVTLRHEIAAFCISNGAQLIYSALYLLLLYNLTLISVEYEWGQFEKGRRRLRCTIVKGPAFDQSYLLQLPKRVMFPVIGYSILMHWLLGLSVYTEEAIVTDGYYNYPTYTVSARPFEALRTHSYFHSHFVALMVKVVTVPASVWGSSALLLVMTIGCWWTYTYNREGYIPQMFGSVRTLCAATSELDTFHREGIQWGDLTKDEHEAVWRRAGLSSAPVKKMIPNELYA